MLKPFILALDSHSMVTLTRNMAFAQTFFTKTLKSVSKCLHSEQKSLPRSTPPDSFNTTRFSFILQNNRKSKC